jgi:hypothetical protein
MRAVPGVLLVRAFHAIRREIPIPLYCSPGNQMIRIEFEPTKLEDAIHSPEFQNLLNEQHRWHAPGRYVTQDIFEYVFHLDSSASAGNFQPSS